MTKGETVDVHEDLGHTLGKHWSKGGYTFEKHEPHEEHPLFKAGLAPKRPTCLVRIVGGFSDGCVVRYYTSDVRRSEVKS
jgi:hypothetical protein